MAIVASVDHEPPLGAQILERLVKPSPNPGTEAALDLDPSASPVCVVDDQVDLRPRRGW